MAKKPLEQELETYNKHLPELLKDEGKYVVIHNSDIIGVYDSLSWALTEGYDKCGVHCCFLVKIIERYEKPAFVTRDLVFV